MWLFAILQTTFALSIHRESFNNPVNKPFSANSSSENTKIGETSYCSNCNPKLVWNDVIYLVDSSLTTGESDLYYSWQFVKSLSHNFNIQRSGFYRRQHMEVGVISYAERAVSLSKLGDWNGDQFRDMEIPLREEKQTNLTGAIQLAIGQFRDSARPNTRKVMVVVANEFRAEVGDETEKVAQSFKDQGGLIMVFDNVNRIPDPYLDKFVSPGYYVLTSNSASQKEAVQAQCDANCFCNSGHVPFSQNERKSPNEGCYSVGTAPANFPLAKKHCSIINAESTLATVTSEPKDYFLKNLFPSPANYLIGLTYDKLRRDWVWQDGTPLSNLYSPWYSGSKPSDSSKGSCVYVMGETQRWVQTDCRNSFEYICQIPPCSAENYCDLK